MTIADAIAKTPRSPRGDPPAQAHAGARRPRPAAPRPPTAALAIARDAVMLVVASGGSRAKRREVLRMIADAALAAEEGL